MARSPASATPAPGATVLDIVVVGCPRPQPRPRVNLKTGRVYSDSKLSAEWKRLVRAAAKAAGVATVQEGVALELEIMFAMPVVDKRKHGKPHTGKRDTDNLEKGVMDALQSERIFADDGQISDNISRKRYSPHPGGARVILRLVDTS